MSALGSFVSGMFGLAGQHAGFEQQKQLLEQQNQYNIDMWKMQNEYNSPAAQMRRFEEAGLNSALMYGQVTPGNATSAPVKQTPEAIKYDKTLREIGQAFNIIDLVKSGAEAEQAIADAKNAKIDAERNKEDFEGTKQFGLDYVFNVNTGRFEEAPKKDEIDVVAYPHARYVKMKALADNFKGVSLIPTRQSLMISQKDLNQERKKYLSPQAEINRYNARYYPWSFWTNVVTKGLSGLGNLLPFFK